MKASLTNIAWLAPRIIRAATTKNKAKTPYYVYRTRYGVCCRFFKKEQMRSLFFKALKVSTGVDEQSTFSNPWFDYKHYQWMCECTKTCALFAVNIEDMVRVLQASLDVKSKALVKVRIATKRVLEKGIEYVGLVIKPEDVNYFLFLEGLMSRASAATIQTSGGEIFGKVLKSKLNSILCYVTIEEAINNG